MRPSQRSSKIPIDPAQPSPIGPRRDFEGMERRRRQAAAMFRRGERQVDIARAFGVTRQAVNGWYQQWREGGLEALKKADRAGRPRLLTPAQLRKVENALLQGAIANAYPTELWTLRRVAEVIEAKTGVAYHPGHVWRILRRLGWSRQKPARRAVERDQEKIDTWVKERWPDLKKGSSEGEPGSSSRTRAASR